MRSLISGSSLLGAEYLLTDMGFFPRTRMPDREWWRVLWPDPEGALKKLGVPKSESSVDLCSGDGYFTAALSRLAAPGEVYALEMDAEIARRTREYLSACGRGNCIVIEDDARYLGRTCPSTSVSP